MLTKKLILVSIFIGVLAGMVSVYILPSKYELLLWAALIITGGAITQKHCSTRLFRKGFVLAVIMGIAITLTHILFVDDYLLGHTDELQQIDEIKIANSPRLTLLVIAPVYWAVFGSLTGLSALLWELKAK